MLIKKYKYREVREANGQVNKIMLQLNCCPAVLGDVQDGSEVYAARWKATPLWATDNVGKLHTVCQNHRTRECI